MSTKKTSDLFKAGKVPSRKAQFRKSLHLVLRATRIISVVAFCGGAGTCQALSLTVLSASRGSLLGHSRMVNPSPDSQGAIWKGETLQESASDAKSKVHYNSRGSLCIQVTKCGSLETESLSLDLIDTTVLHIKKNLVAKWGVPVDKQVLVCCGEVLEDHLEINQIVEQLQQEVTLWLVLRNLPEYDPGKNIRLKTQEYNCNAPPALRSIFDVSGYELGPISSHEQCIATFSAFCDIYGQAHNGMGVPIPYPENDHSNFQSLTWTPSQEQKDNLVGAKLALRNGGSSNFPQLMWYRDYGCALMATSTRQGLLSLQVAPFLVLFSPLPLLSLSPPTLKSLLINKNTTNLNADFFSRNHQPANFAHFADYCT